MTHSIGQAQARGATRIFVSPLARRLAREAELDLAALRGSGPDGRIVAEDVRAAAASKRTSKDAGGKARAGAGGGADPFSPRALAEALGRPHEITPHPPVRRIVARRLTESKQQVPHYYLAANCRADELLRLRARLNEAAQGRYKLSVNDLVVRAMVASLQDVPEANVAFDEEGLVAWGSVDIAIAVATDDGLFTPVVRDAETLSLPALASSMRALAEKARAGKLKPEEYLGGCFSVSNLGMFGVSDFAAVINPPQSGILAVGAAEPWPFAAEGGAVETGQQLRLTLSLDHRALDGALGARLLRALRGHIERPLLLAL